MGDSMENFGPRPSLAPCEPPKEFNDKQLYRDWLRDTRDSGSAIPLVF